MAADGPTFDDAGLKRAVRRHVQLPRASAQLRERVTGMLAAGAAGSGAVSRVEPAGRSAATAPKVFGLPRHIGIAAAVLLCLSGATLLTIQLRDTFRGRTPSPSLPSYYSTDYESTFAAIHAAGVAEPGETELAAFKRTHGQTMAIAQLDAPEAKFVGVRMATLEGRPCVAVRYLLNGQPLTLLTADNGGMRVSDYDSTLNGTRLVGGERSGWIVCLVGSEALPPETLRDLSKKIRLDPAPPATSRPAGGDAAAMVGACH